MTQKRFAVTVKMKSANTCTILIHQQGITSAQLKCETMGFEIQQIYSPPAHPPPPQKKKIAYALFSVSLGTAVIPGEI